MKARPKRPVRPPEPPPAPPPALVKPEDLSAINTAEVDNLPAYISIGKFQWKPPLPGPKGDKGDKGDPGEPGATARPITPPVATAEIADSAVTKIKLASNSVGYLEIINDSVTTPKIVNGAVTSPKLGYKIVDVVFPYGVKQISTAPDPELVNGVIIGWSPYMGCVQLLTDCVLQGDGSIVALLNANGTGNPDFFKVAVLRP